MLIPSGHRLIELLKGLLGNGYTDLCGPGADARRPDDQLMATAVRQFDKLVGAMMVLTVGGDGSVNAPKVEHDHALPGGANALDIRTEMLVDDRHQRAVLSALE